MMDRKRNGGPAFPRPGYYPDSNGLEHGEKLELRTHPEDGMSLRDYFAGQALMGLMANSDLADLMKRGFNPEPAAEAVYIVADAMMKERQK